MFLLVDVGNARGIWASNGLFPDFAPAAGSSEQLKERIDAGIEVGFVNTAEVTLASASGVQVKTVAGYFGETSARLFVAANGPARTASDLDGRKIGIVAATHTSYRAVLYMNKTLAIRAEPVPVGSLANNIAALQSGEIDAFYASEGAALARVDSGELRILLPFSDIYPQPYTAVVVWATSDLIQRNPDLVARFVKATLETVVYLQQHPSEASAFYSKRTGAPKAVADRVIGSLNHYLTADGRGSGQDLAAAVDGNWRFMTASGAVPAGIDVRIGEVVDDRFLPRR